MIVDRKSEVAPEPKDIGAHTVQLQDYLRATGAPRGALVYITMGSVPRRSLGCARRRTDEMPG